MPEAKEYVCMNHSPASHYFKSRAEDDNVKCPKCKLSEYVHLYIGPKRVMT